MAVNFHGEKSRPGNSKVIITCGPSAAPLDSVRRITNHSTGELGEMLSAGLCGLGWDVICLRGKWAVARAPMEPVEVREFETNADLESLLEGLQGSASAVLHAAALSDFEVKEILADGRLVEGRTGKIRSDVRSLEVRLRPAKKLIQRLRELFPDAFLAGWKYEVEGSFEDCVERGRKQALESSLDGCVVNGPALGSVFVWVEPGGCTQILGAKWRLPVFFHEKLSLHLKTLG